MSKLRTLEAFEAHVTEDIKWREAELDTWYRLVEKVREHQRTGLLRGGIALLYAHWEGFVKEAARAYLEYVSLKGLRIGQLSAELAAVSLRSMLERSEQSKTSKDHTTLVSMLRSQDSHVAQMKFDRAMIRTHSNLTFDRFVDIMHSVGCDGRRHELYRAMIDNRLVKMRNDVAHGRNEEIVLQDWVDMHERIRDIMKDVRTQLNNAAATESYLLNPQSNKVTLEKKRKNG